ncbi:uncharacterized protein LOC127254530 [Andrographis paniculata]|uniref:uncharacterized protein LOC127254530 n=1 Tax=Andrographis paniculata TaxID=175694 RepID=UPI0021E81FF0|nr:uncharacterized protein LOC127254530 [Andrographis paniculata]
MEESTTNVAPKFLEPWHRLEDKVVMVTGASSGLGREFCLDLSKAGCRVIAAARRTDKLRSLCDEINSGAVDRGEGDRPRAVAVELDLSANGAAIEASVRKAWEAFGRIDALINNAGVRGRVHTPWDLSEKEWDEIVGTNMTGTWLVSKYVCMRMREAQRGGSIINISSIASVERGLLPGGLAYVSSKGSVNSITKVMALELGPNKIRVNSIAPGLFKSEITKGLVEKEWLKNVERRTVPLRVFGKIDPALTSLLRYLIHDSSVYVTGNIFIVDSGNTLPGTPIFSSL